MKGIAHFTTGVALTSFFPFAVEAAQAGNPVYFILGGGFGILPDTLDFKFYRYFYTHDVVISPDPLEKDVQGIADKLAEAVGRGHESPNGCRVKLDSIRMGADNWQQYIVKFDPTSREVIVCFGPVVNTGQVPLPGTDSDDVPEGRAELPCDIEQSYDSVTTVDIFDGPSFLFERGEGKDHVDIHFLPWHRSWTHSLVLGVAFGMLVWLFWGGWKLLSQGGLSGFITGWRACAVIVCAYAGHILEDQLGFMGSNLLFPFSGRRTKGMHVMRSGDAFPNFLTVWLCIVLIFWNLYRNTPDCVYEFNFLQLMFYAVVLPIGIFGLLFRFANRKKLKDAEEVDTGSEWSDSMMG